MYRRKTKSSRGAEKKSSTSAVFLQRVSDQVEASHSRSKSATPGIDEIRWEEMPKGPMEIIICRLSLLEVVRMRAVCQTWKRSIDSPEFLSYYDQNHAEPCFMVRCEWKREDRILAYFPLVQSWKVLPKSLIQPQKSGCSTQGTCSPSGPSKNPLAQGIWWIQSYGCNPHTREIELRELREIGGRSRHRRVSALDVSVHNPLSGWYSLLPGYPDPELKFYSQCEAVSVMVRVSRGIFKVLCAGIHAHDQKEACRGKEAKCLSTLLFDSTSNRWMRVADLPLSNLKFCRDHNNQVTKADYGSMSYFVIQNVDELTLLGFNHESGTWNLIPGQMPPHHNRYVPISLSRRKGSLILALRRTTAEWTLGSSAKWTIVDFLFPQIFSWDCTASPNIQTWEEIELLEPPLRDISSYDLVGMSSFKWYVQGDFIFFTCYDIWGLGALVFNLVSKSWKVTSFVSDDLPALKDVLQQIVPLEVQLSAVLNWTGSAQNELSIPSYCMGLCDQSGLRMSLPKQKKLWCRARGPG